MKPGRWWRSLQARVTLAYAVGALLLASTIAGAAYGLALNRLLAEAESQHRTQVFFNVRDIGLRLGALPEDAGEEEINSAYDSALDELSSPRSTPMTSP